MLLLTTEIYFSQLRREVQDQGAGRFGVWWGLASWFIDGCLLAVSSRGGGGEGAPWGLFVKGTNLSHMGSTHDLITSQRLTPSPNTITLGVRISTYEFGGDKSFQVIAPHVEVP